MEPETTEELLSRLEREHVSCDGTNCELDEAGPHCIQTAIREKVEFEPWPCDVARVVAHARSLEAARRIPRESQSEERP